MKPDFNISVRWGVIGGLVMSAITVLMYMFYKTIFGSVWLQAITGFLTFGLLVFFAVWGGVLYKRSTEDTITLWQAFVAVFTILILTMLISTVTTLFINYVLDPEYSANLREHVVSRTEAFLEKQGLSDEVIEKQIEKIKNSDEFDFSLKGSAKSLLKSSVFGAVLSFIIALFVRRPVRTGASDTASKPAEA
ncbi:MAG: DUF4199 domain-containing protein [Chitinophagales bacterium]|nr:DUF4199 domain-containing protein [Chitinophagales bacterium]MDW8419624.1 DUF4199 domain-containing protein [Chitinophagales bacterium]